MSATEDAPASRRADIAVIGCGAMGSIYAARLSAAGNNVLAIVRSGEQAEHLTKHGLRVEGPAGDQTVRLRASVTSPPERMDLVILAMKAADVADGGHTALPMLGETTVVLAMQNGLGSAERLAEIVGANRLAVGIASGFGASVRGIGHVHHSAMRAVRLGHYASREVAGVGAIAQLWREAGFDAEAVPDIVSIQWEKLICNAAYSAPCALTGLTCGEVMDDPELGPISRAAAIEAWRVARAACTKITVRDPIAHVRAFGSAVREAKPSALLDHEVRRRSEIDFINGAVVREAARHGLEAPVNTMLVGLVKAKERGWH